MEQVSFECKVRLVEDMLGTVPHNKDVYTKHVINQKIAAELAEEEAATVQSIEERGYTGFHQDERGEFLYNYVIKGNLCESARAMKQYGAMKQLQDKFKRYVFVNPRRLYLPKVTRSLERPLRAMTAQGPRVTVVKSDLVPAGTEISFTVDCLGDVIKEPCLREVLSYGKFMGLGQWRSGGYGAYELVSLEEI